MDGDRTARALARIEAASARIEAATARRASSGNPADSELQARYDRLRGEANAALAQLDALIGTLEA